MILAHFGDAAYPGNLDGTSFAGVAGYIGGTNALHVWSRADWQRFPGWKVPIWVASPPGPDAGRNDARAALDVLRTLGVPPGCVSMLDMEARKDDTYVEAFGALLQAAGYKVMVYGSASTVALNPPLNGYWLADYGPGGSPLPIDRAMELLRPTNVRALQYASNRLYDSSLVKHWTEGEMWK